MGCIQISPEELAILRKKRGSVAGRPAEAFTPGDITDIRERYWIEKVTIKVLSEDIGVSKTTISSIVNGRTYKHVPFPDEWFK